MAEHENSKDQGLLLLSGGVALMVMGAGLIIANPGVRRLMMNLIGASTSGDGENDLTSTAAGLLPDIERYLKIRSM